MSAIASLADGSAPHGEVPILRLPAENSKIGVCEATDIFCRGGTLHRQANFAYARRVCWNARGRFNHAHGASGRTAHLARGMIRFISAGKCTQHYFDCGARFLARSFAEPGHARPKLTERVRE